MNSADVLSATAGDQFLLSRGSICSHLPTRFSGAGSGISYGESFDEMHTEETFCVNQHSYQDENLFSEQHHVSSLLNFSLQLTDGISENNLEFPFSQNYPGNDYYSQGAETYNSNQATNFRVASCDETTFAQQQLPADITVKVLNNQFDNNARIDNTTGFSTVQPAKMNPPRPLSTRPSSTGFAGSIQSNSERSSFLLDGREPADRDSIFPDCAGTADAGQPQQCFYRGEQRQYRSEQAYSNDSVCKGFQSMSDFSLSHQNVFYANEVQSDQVPSSFEDDFDDVFVPSLQHRQSSQYFNNSRHASTPGLMSASVQFTNHSSLLHYPPKTHSNPTASTDDHSFKQMESFNETPKQVEASFPLTKKEDLRRERNNKACKKFREKRKRRHQELESDLRFLQEENCKLKTKISKLQSEILKIRPFLSINVAKKL